MDEKNTVRRNKRGEIKKVKRKERLCCYFVLYPSTCLTWEALPGV